MRVLRAFLRRAFIEQTAEATSAAFALLSFVLGMATQLFLGRLVDTTQNPALGTYAGRYSAFLIIGIAMLDLQHAIVTGLSTRIRAAQREGALESMLATPTSPGSILVGCAANDVVWSLMRVGVYLVLGTVFFGLDLRAISGVATIVSFLVVCAAFAALALIGGALTMYLRRGNPIALVIGAMSAISGGVFYPRSVLPPLLSKVGSLLPITSGLEALRASVIEGESLAAVAPSLVRLALFAVFGGLVGVISFGRALDEARKEGSLTSL